MGPVITPESKARINDLINLGISEGANLLLDGRAHEVSGYHKGNFIAPTILENLALDGKVIETEIFGPVMSLLHMRTVEEAISFINKSKYTF